MENSISQYAISDLLDGRYFYIPAYQRGYRWTEKQVGDLLRDLLCFANDYANDRNGETQDQFYCLQPIIARRITDVERLKSIFAADYSDSIPEHGVWEIIDGQQRLTTIFLLYKYLLDEKQWDAEKLKEEEDGKELYHLRYATREGSAEFLESLTLKTAREEHRENIDFYHMANAFRHIDEWIKSDGREINKRYQLGGSLDNIRASFFKLLNGASDTKGGSVRVLWYEIAEDREKDNIKEFQKINTGKIRLTEGELVKGLFLQKKNFPEGDKYIKQSELAFQWEHIENTLHADSFWYFLQKKGSDMPNRIDYLFSLVYKTTELAKVTPQERSKKLAEINRDLANPKSEPIFRSYYSRFEGRVGDDLQREVSEAWKEVMDLFHTLDDWFSDPKIYNYIGLLSQCGEDLTNVVMHYNKDMAEDSSRADFEDYLKRRIARHLHNCVDLEKRTFNVSYKDRAKVFRLLLTLNIHILNEQAQYKSEINKFPFEALNAQDWDIEHIDSYTTNQLRKEEDKRDWIASAWKDLQHCLPEEKREEVEQLLEGEDLDEIVRQLKKAADEVDEDEETKNQIGNLTLLDAQTNRSYGNSLFCQKRRVIRERIELGVFVPVATQYVFFKFFDEYGTNRSAWTKKDMVAYHDYIYKKLETYFKEEEDAQ